jgi:guanine deaminase
MADNRPEEKFMLLAIKRAKLGIKRGQTPFAACIVKGNKVISCAHNLVWRRTDITAHAEINAIRQACKKLKSVDLSGCVIYSTCEPCPMCFSACHWAKIKRIIFGSRIEDAKELGFSELTIPDKTMKQLGVSPVKVTGDFLREENIGLFKLWSKQKRRLIY